MVALLLGAWRWRLSKMLTSQAVWRGFFLTADKALLTFALPAFSDGSSVSLQSGLHQACQRVVWANGKSTGSRTPVAGFCPWLSHCSAAPPRASVSSTVKWGWWCYDTLPSLKSALRSANESVLQELSGVYYYAWNKMQFKFSFFGWNPQKITFRNCNLLPGHSLVSVWISELFSWAKALVNNIVLSFTRWRNSHWLAPKWIIPAEHVTLLYVWQSPAH